jgi:hypothetical protein
MSNDEIKTVFMASAWQNYQNHATGENVQPSDHGFIPGQLARELGDTKGKLVAAESVWC